MQAEFQKYDVKFSSEVKFFDKYISTRHGLFLTISDGKYSVESEIPFFPNSDFATIEFNISAIVQFAKDFEIKSIKLHDIFSATAELGLHQSFLFGLNAGLLDLYLQFSGEKQDLSEVTSYNLYQNYAQFSAAHDTTCPKIKFSGSLEEISQLNQADCSLLRLDFNRKYDYIASSKILSQLDLSGVLYIEEPLADIFELPKLKQQFSFPLALDETLIERKADLDLLNLADIFVIKPAIIGDYDYIFKLINFAKINHKGVVISSSYETKVGIRSLKQLICYANLQNSSHGLDTEKFISEICSIKNEN